MGKLSKIVFGLKNETIHDYTWDYTTKEKVVELFDIDKENFAIYTKLTKIADETGAMGDYRDNSYNVLKLCSKADFNSSEKISLDAKKSKNTDLIERAKKSCWGKRIRKVDELVLNEGRLYIFEGNLMLRLNENF